MNRYRIFIGSSTESKPISEGIASGLTRSGYSPLPWWDAFDIGDITLSKLHQLLEMVDGAIFVFTGDDSKWYRGENIAATRDNVMLEYGMFSAKLGLDKAIIISEPALRMPSDLHALTTGKIDSDIDNIISQLTKHFDRVFQNSIRSIQSSSVKMSSSALEKQVGNLLPAEWGCRSLYLGLTGAKNWLSIVNDPNYYKADYFEKIVAKLLAEEFLKNLEFNTLVSLGPGDGVTDQILCTHFGRVKRINYVPVDINPYLLAEAIKTVGSVARTEMGIVCDFEDELDFLGNELRTHTWGPYLFTILGYTVCNLDRREGKFFSNISNLMRKGDLLLFDYLAIEKGWQYRKYREIWHTEWDSKMRKLICDACSKRTNEDSRVLLSEFESRFKFEIGKSDLLKESFPTRIVHRATGLLATNIRRYYGFSKWLSNFHFELVKENLNIEQGHAGTGYVLVKKR